MAAGIALIGLWSLLVEVSTVNVEWLGRHLKNHLRLANQAA
jgi:hypothetical protein